MKDVEVDKVVNFDDSGSNRPSRIQIDDGVRILFHRRPANNSGVGR